MPMRYAHQPDVVAQLKIKQDNTAAIESVTRLENGLANAFDQKVGHGFGEAPMPETRTVRGNGSDVLALGYPGVRNITGITVGGWWDAVSELWMDETLLLPSSWLYWTGDYGQGVTTIRLIGGLWTGPVRVTAIWADQPLAAVPDDVREAMTFLTIRQYRRQTASPSEVLGPDGMPVPTPHAWDDPMVKSAIAHHRVKRARVGV